MMILSFFLLFLVNIQSLLATDTCSVKVDISQICLQEDGMYMTYNGKTVPISSLEFIGGEYVAKTPDGIIEDILGLWWCYNCRNYNSKFDKHCIYCGKPR